MALIILEGLDRTGKTTVTEYYESLGYQSIHLSAPDKKHQNPDYSGPTYLDEMIEILQDAVMQNIILDRSYYGELIWPSVYNRKKVLSDEDLAVLKELEVLADARKILMHDPNTEAHWKRCVENKEPLTKPQFIHARKMFNSLITDHGFSKLTLPDFLEASGQNKKEEPQNIQKTITDTKPKVSDSIVTKSNQDDIELIKLQRANAINDVLSSRILKKKGSTYDDIENLLRSLLKNELSKIFNGDNSNNNILSKEEVQFFKMMFKKATKG